MKVQEISQKSLKLFEKIYKFRIPIILTLDSISVYLSVLISYLILSYSKNLIYQSIKISSFLILLTLIIYSSSTIYKSIIRYIDSFIIFKFIQNNILIIFLTYLSFKLLNLNSLTINFYFLYFIVFTCFNCLIRFGMRDLFLIIQKNAKSNKKRIAIYGAGKLGYQVGLSLVRSKEYKVFAFIDDDKKLSGRKLLGYDIYNPSEFDKIANQVDQIFLTTKNSNGNQINISKKIKNNTIPIIRIPSIEESKNKNEIISKLIPISPEKLLFREPIKADKNLLIKGIKGDTICVTGAGGSIGSELSRQLSKLLPKRLILIDNCEHNLYRLNQQFLNKKLDIHLILGDVTSKKFLRTILTKFQVNIIFHAAAYKHVPIVENNSLQGIKNNVFSTLLICELARELRLKKVIYISSDKAVRPTNVMGSTKRLGEIITQAYADLEKSSEKKSKLKDKTLFAMVRFGNVVGSSGSVIPLFKEQIKMGGPVTVTDRNIVRYFMSVEEASQLVIQAAQLTKGGEVFLIDMGNPINIFDLAKQMIIRSGFKLKNKDNPNGEIEIKITGLRTGEKLFEELLIDANSIETEHPKIYKAYEKTTPPKELFKQLSLLEKYVNNEDSINSLEVLSRLVPDWKRVKIK